MMISRVDEIPSGKLMKHFHVRDLSGATLSSTGPRCYIQSHLGFLGNDP